MLRVPGSTLKIARESRRWTQSELAKKLSVGGAKIAQHAISRYEKSAEIPAWLVPQLDHVFGGSEWRARSEHLIAEGPPSYGSIAEQLAEMSRAIKALAERVTALEQTRRPIRK